MKNRLIDVACKKEPADLVLKNARIVDVLTATIYDADVAIADGRIAGIGRYTDAAKSIDLENRYLCPGLINAHCHVESSMTLPEYYCTEELRWGVTTLITDPHEIANVAGADGIRYMLDAVKKMPINYYVQMPSCVPATFFEHSGCVLDVAAMQEICDLPGVLGLGEVMNVPGVLGQDEEVMKKLSLFEGRPVDGHAPGITGEMLQGYAAAGIHTDHEATTWEEAREKLRAGIAVLVREGSASKNLKAILVGALAEGIDFSRMAFCTDDKHLADIRKEGTIRWCIKQAVELGMQPIHAIQMATIHAAQIYGLSQIGAIAPGWQADLVVWEDLKDFIPYQVYHRGVHVSGENELDMMLPMERLRSSVCVAPFSKDIFTLPKPVHEVYPVIQILPHEIITERSEIPSKDVADALNCGELCKIAVFERHHETGHVGVGLLRGYGLRNGAIATTVAHDSHNLIVVGTNDEDMLLAVRELERVQGGYTIVHDGRVVDTLPLPVCGLMSMEPADSLIARLDVLSETAHSFGVYSTIDPFITLSFMALPVIPKLRITDMGMFDAEHFCFL